MPLRDLIFFVIVFGSLPFVFKRPWIGILVCAWLGYMNLSRYTWGPAIFFPFVQIVAIVTLVAFIISRENKKLPENIVILLLFLLIFWVSLTTLTALNPAGAAHEWKRFVKIQILNFGALYLLQNRKRINWLIAVIAGSIGFYAFKGGLFTLATGGIYRVSGPDNTFISGNTEIGFASTVILPLMYYLHSILEKKWQKYAMVFVMFFSAIGIVGTHSRGAFLAFLILCGYFWLISQRKAITIIVLACFIPVIFSAMPEKYFERMETIKTYGEDGSALGRINAWRFAFNLANDRPLVGGGANAFTQQLFNRYAPEPEMLHDSHSIYFEMLGEQGYPGLMIFLAMLFFSYRNCVWVKKRTKDEQGLKWAFDLARMLQASFVAYSVGGAFLGLAYFDLLYHLVALSVLCRTEVERKLQGTTDTSTESLSM